MFILPVVFLVYFILSRNFASRAIGIVGTFTIVFTTYELALFFLPMIGLNPFDLILSNLIQLLPLILLAFTHGKIPTRVKSIPLVTYRNKLRYKPSGLVYYLPSLMAVSIIVVGFLKHGIGILAFAMSGDARNHVWFARFISDQQGLNSSSTSFYPVLPDAMIALVRSSLNFYKSYATNELTLDLISISLMCLIVLILMSLVHMLFGETILPTKSKFTVIAVFVLSAIPYSALVSRISLIDGFYPALFASLSLQVFFLTSILLIKAKDEREISFLLITVLLLLPLIASTWTVLLIFPCAYIILTLLTDRDRILSVVKNRWNVKVAALVSALGLSLNLIPLLTQGAASNYVKLNGAISPPPVRLVFSVLTLFFLYLLWVFLRSRQKETLFLIMMLTVLFTTFLLLALMQENSNYWNYYPAKFTWICLISLLPLLISIGIRDFHLHARSLSLVFLPVIILLSWSFTNSPWLKYDFFGSNSVQSDIYAGWFAPSSVSVNQVLNFGQKNEPTAFWELSDPSGDRLANFWLSTYLPARFDNPVLATNYLRDWAYFQTPGDINSLCDFLVNSELIWRVITKNPSLSNSIKASCPGEELKNRIVTLK